MTRSVSGFKSAVNLLKSAAPGAIGAAVADLYALDPLVRQLPEVVSRDARFRPLAKVAGAVGIAVLADKFGPSMVKKHAAAFLTGSLAINARDLVANLTGHPIGTISELADQYDELVAADMDELTAGHLGGMAESEMDDVAELVEAGY